MRSVPQTRPIYSADGSHLRVFLLWVAATAGTATAGWGAISVATLRLAGGDDPDAMFAGDNGLSTIIWFGLCLVLAWAPLVGLAQGAALRSVFHKGVTTLWVVSTGISGLLVIVLVICAALGGGPPELVWALLPGVVLGVCQCAALWRVVRSQAAGVWMFACFFAWLLGIVTGTAAHMMLYKPGDGAYDLPYYPLEALAAWGASVAVGSITYGIITGGALVWVIARTADGLSNYKEPEQNEQSRA